MHCFTNNVRNKVHPEQKSLLKKQMLFCMAAVVSTATGFHLIGIHVQQQFGFL